VTCKVSPEITLLLVEKSATPNKVPVVPDVADAKNAPATVAVALTAKSTELALVIEPLLAAPSVHSFLVPE
jgi:hypothetical protein